MFTGFPSENTPAIKVWDCSGTSFASSAIITLTDDCAPIQIVRTGGGSGMVISLYLPVSPTDGRQITIVNEVLGNYSADIYIYTSDMSANMAGATYGYVGTAQPIGFVNPGSTNTYVYSRYIAANGTSNGPYSTGWVPLTGASISAKNYGALALGWGNNRAQGAYSATLGGYNQSANGLYAVSIGGSSNVSSAQGSAVMGGSTNTASASGSIILGSSNSSASGINSAVLGASSGVAQGNYSVAIGGVSLSAGEYCSAAIGGQVQNANGQHCFIGGGIRGTAKGVTGLTAFPASAAPLGAVYGGSQLSVLNLAYQTTSATPAVLTSNTLSASTTNTAVLSNNSAFMFTGTVIAAVTGAGDTSSWTFSGAIKRGASAGTTALVAAVTPILVAQNVGAAAWAVAVTADTSIGSLAVTVTGAAGITIRWVCTLQMTEVAF